MLAHIKNGKATCLLIRQHCRLSICIHIDWLWQIHNQKQIHKEIWLWDELACLLLMQWGLLMLSGFLVFEMLLEFRSTKTLKNFEYVWNFYPTLGTASLHIHAECKYIFLSNLGRPSIKKSHKTADFFRTPLSRSDICH